jgi:REP element-mobilizing transposase RayT
MAIARARLVDLSVARWYHCITRCVRRACLLGEGNLDRRAWIEQRLAKLGEVFSIAVGGFSVLDNHLHVLLRLDPELAAGWSDEEVARRWAKLFPPRDGQRKPVPVSQQWIDEKLRDPVWIARARERLQSLSWFMKCLKEPLARMANREDKATGAFFEERFKSIAIVDEEALLAACVYIDLNPVAAGIAQVPEESPHTSVKQRVGHVEAQGRMGELIAAPNESVGASVVAGGLEETLWLCPIEDRRGLDSSREGMFVGFPLKSYLLLVDYTGRIFRDGKARISAELAKIFDRLGCPADRWSSRLKRLQGGRLTGRIFASSKARLQEIAAKLNVRHLVNYGGCLA